MAKKSKLVFHPEEVDKMPIGSDLCLRQRLWGVNDASAPHIRAKLILAGPRDIVVSPYEEDNEHVSYNTRWLMTRHNNSEAFTYYLHRGTQGVNVTAFQARLIDFNLWAMRWQQLRISKLLARVQLSYDGVDIRFSRDELKAIEAILVGAELRFCDPDVERDIVTYDSLLIKAGYKQAPARSLPKPAMPASTTPSTTSVQP